MENGMEWKNDYSSWDVLDLVPCAIFVLFMTMATVYHCAISYLRMSGGFLLVIACYSFSFRYYWASVLYPLEAG